MMSNNKKEEQVKKRCPFNNEWCGDWCPRYVTVNRVDNMGRQSHAGMCVDIATNLMISEINMKTMPPQMKQVPKIQLPGNLQFGRG